MPEHTHGKMLLAFAAGGCGAALASGRALLGALLTGLVERMEVGTAGRAEFVGHLAGRVRLDTVQGPLCWRGEDQKGVAGVLPLASETAPEFGDICP